MEKKEKQNEMLKMTHLLYLIRSDTKFHWSFMLSFYLATHLETSQLIWFTNQLAGIYRICKNIESDLGHVGPNTFSCF